MSQPIPENVDCTVSLKNGNYLTNHTKGAVVSLFSGTNWSLKRHGDPGSPNAHYTISCRGTEQRGGALTLNDGPPGEDGSIDITVQDLMNPPLAQQLWTFEDSIIEPRARAPAATETAEPEHITHLGDYPVLSTRIQSVANPELSVAIGGHTALPRSYLNVAALPNDVLSGSQQWVLDPGRRRATTWDIRG